MNTPALQASCKIDYVSIVAVVANSYNSITTGDHLHYYHCKYRSYLEEKEKYACQPKTEILQRQ